MEEGSNASSSINPLLFDGLCTRNNTNSNASSIINPLLFDGLCTRNNTVKTRASIDSHCHSHTNDGLIAACFKYPIKGHGIDEDNNALEKKGSFFPGGLHDQYCSPLSRITTRDNATEIVYYDKNVSLGSEKRPYNQGGGSLVTSSSFRTGQCHPWPSIIDVSDDAKAFGDESVISTRSHDHELHENPAPCYDGMSSLYSHLPSSSNPMVMNHQREKPCNSLLYTSNNNCKENLDSIDVTLSSPISFKHGSLPHSTHDNIPYNEDPLISSNPNVVAIQGGEGGGHMNAITNKDTSSYSHPMDREIGNDGYTFAPVCSGGTHETSAEMSVKELSNSASKGKTHMDEAYCTQSKLDADGDSGEVSQPRKRSSSKRSRVAENHNLSEKRRRNRINEKLRSMQALIPNSTKTDKASILDEAIEYLKSLQSQLQIMSSRNSLRMSPMMNVPSVIQHHLHTMNQVTPRPNHMDGHIGNLPINMSSNLITPSFEHALRPSNVLDSQINSTQTHIDDAINMASSSNDFWSTHHDIPSKKARL